MSYSHSSSHPVYVTTGLIKINGAKFRFGVRFFPRVAGGWAMHPQATGAGCTRGGGVFEEGTIPLLNPVLSSVDLWVRN